MKRKSLRDLSGRCTFVQLMSKWGITKKESLLGVLRGGGSLESKDSRQMSICFRFIVNNMEIQPK